MMKPRRTEPEVAAASQLCRHLCETLGVNTPRRQLQSPQGHLAHRLFAEHDLLELGERLEYLSKDSEARLQSYINMLERRGPFIRLVKAPVPAVLSPLRTRFPHFGAVLDWVEGHLALAEAAGNAALELPPLCLGGDPGVGKTYFARQLASTLATHYEEIPMSANTGGFSIGGLDLGWSTGQAGRVFCTLVQEGLANPVILLDELDKVSGEGRFDSLGALYGLLENGTARRFADEAVQLRMDASKIIWVATANDLAQIPDPILSRMNVFDIPTPTADEGCQIAALVYQDLRQQQAWGAAFTEILDPAVTAALAATPPRAMRRSLTSAASHAARHGRRCIQLLDLERPARRQPMGFI